MSYAPKTFWDGHAGGPQGSPGEPQSRYNSSEETTGNPAGGGRESFGLHRHKILSSEIPILHTENQ